MSHAGNRIRDRRKEKNLTQRSLWEEVSKLQGKSMELDEKAADWLYCPTQCGKRTFATTVQGDSMTSPYPNNKSYPAGIVIFVDPDATLSTGSRVLAKRDNSTEATFKEYIKDGGVSYLKPINPQYPTVVLESDSEIIGVIIGSYSAE